MNSPTRLVLASQSPRRRELLAEAGYKFDVIVPDEAAECGVCSSETPPELVARLARQKAANVASQVDRGVILGCDTVAECQGRVLGKPEHLEHAREMLQLMRGRLHRVYSGVCLWRRPDNQTVLQVAVTRLLMDPLSDAQIDEYLATDLWIGKAGAFGYQDRLGWVHVQDGSESNVVGLPLEILPEMFQALATG